MHRAWDGAYSDARITGEVVVGRKMISLPMATKPVVRLVLRSEDPFHGLCLDSGCAVLHDQLWVWLRPPMLFDQLRSSENPDALSDQSQMEDVRIFHLCDTVGRE